MKNAIIVLVCLMMYSIRAQEVRNHNGQNYLVTSLSKSQVGDPYALAVKYGKASNWKDILIVRGGSVLKMTDSLSTTIDDNESLLVPLSWVPSGSRPPTPPPTQPPTPPPPRQPPTQPPTRPPPSNPPPPTSGTWKKAIATYYESYPTTQEEAEQFSGDKYKGMFAFFPDQKPLSWVQSHNIAAIHDKFWNSYKGKNIKISLYPDGRNAMDVQVLDMCSDSDCDNCCSDNMRQANVDFLIDLEKFTAARFLGTSPEQVVSGGLYRTIYYSLPAASAVGENSRTFSQAEPVADSLSPTMIGLIVGISVLVVVIVVVVIIVFTKKPTLETV